MEKSDPKKETNRRINASEPKLKLFRASKNKSSQIPSLVGKFETIISGMIALLPNEIFDTR